MQPWLILESLPSITLPDPLHRPNLINLISLSSFERLADNLCARFCLTKFINDFSSFVAEAVECPVCWHLCGTWAPAISISLHRSHCQEHRNCGLKFGLRIILHMGFTATSYFDGNEMRHHLTVNSRWFGLVPILNSIWSPMRKIRFISLRATEDYLSQAPLLANHQLYMWK